MPTLFTCNDLVFGYPRRPLAQGNPLTLKLEEGFRLGLWGPNGSGKSTFLKTILGLIAPLQGSIHWQEGIRIGFVPQDLALTEILPMTVREVLLSLAHREASIEKIAQLVDIQDILDQPWRELSRGQRQRTLIGRALMRKPRVLILDEPYSALDEKIIARLIVTLKQENTSINLIIIDHDRERLWGQVDEVLEFTETGIVRKGRHD